MLCKAPTLSVNNRLDSDELLEWCSTGHLQNVIKIKNLSVQCAVNATKRLSMSRCVTLLRHSSLQLAIKTNTLKGAWEFWTSSYARLGNRTDSLKFHSIHMMTNFS